ncbi:hypothetical protein BpHYR1_015337 [Brachionus plicatilis]|uniref:Uncharacterized protein n=1 Tax=Brachionus plicatilis TaxID=10195 RepID=A0A3M7PYI8_BRAPC|nr:hypothetical protein BpHYR1_015337 [Brachionus plicatilis]
MNSKENFLNYNKGWIRALLLESSARVYVIIYNNKNKRQLINFNMETESKYFNSTVAQKNKSFD